MNYNLNYCFKNLELLIDESKWKSSSEIAIEKRVLVLECCNDGDIDSKLTPNYVPVITQTQFLKILKDFSNLKLQKF